MIVRKIALNGWRNYEFAAAEFSPGTNVITGENAQGKTNLLEAVYLLTGGKSFRTRFDKELIGFGYTSAEVLADVFAFGREQTVRIVLRQGQRKQIWQNGVKKTAAELAGTFAAVLFCPDDLNIIRDGPAARRRMMDMAISQLRPKYGALLAEYSRLYDQKSAILRDWHEKPSLLDTLDDFSDQMCRVSAKLIRYRAAYASRLNIAAAPIHADFSGGRDKLTLAYRTVSTVVDALGTEKEIYYALCDHQEQHRRAELDSGQCLTGAHKDDLIISINGQSARAFASQGQTRTAALSLKLAEREIFHDEFDEYPVLMLDDVLSELDARRQDFVLNQIRSGQVLITFEKKINDKHLNVNVDMPEHPVYTMANPDYITQVIYNLIDNAVKFCPDGGNLGLRIKEGGSKAYVSVSNDGETIPPDELPLVFDRFHKLDKSRSQNRDGWGLGLYIVKTIVCSHGEDISVSSKDGKTEFTFTMPLVN